MSFSLYSSFQPLGLKNTNEPSCFLVKFLKNDGAGLTLKLIEVKPFSVIEYVLSIEFFRMYSSSVSQVIVGSIISDILSSGSSKVDLLATLYSSSVSKLIEHGKFKAQWSRIKELIRMNLF